MQLPEARELNTLQGCMRIIQTGTKGLNATRGRGSWENAMNHENESLIALFIDYDNIAIGLRESGGQPFAVRKVLERLLEKGRIIYKRAYADWGLFSDAKQSLHEHAIEMIDIPMRHSIGKNSADIRLVVDALDLCYTKEHIDTFVIGSGDSDFTPLVAKLKENDKVVIGFGLAQSTSNLLANNCDEFIFYEDLVSLPINRPPLPVGLTKRQHDAFSLMLDAVAALMRENKDVLWGSLIKDTIRRKRPSFTESQYGYSSFSQLLEDAAKHQLIGLIKDPKSGGTPVVTGFGLAGESGAAPRQPGQAQAAPAPAKAPSLVVKQGGGHTLPVTEEPEEAKPKTSRAAPRRKSPAKKTARKAADENGAKQADVAKKKKPAESAAAEEKPEPKKPEEKPEAKKPEKKPARRRPAAKGAPEKDKPVRAKKPAPAKKEKPAPEAEAEPKSKLKPRRGRAKEPAPADEKKGAAPAGRAESPGENGKARSGESGDREKPKGRPLKSRIRRRKR